MAIGKSPDIIIVGAGIFGLASAYFAAKAGLQVLMFEAKRIGDGASGGIVGAMAPHMPDQWNEKKQFQYEALVSAQAFWKEVDTLSGAPSGYGRIGRVIPLVTEKERALAEVRITHAAQNWNGFDWQVQNSTPHVDPDYASFGLIIETLSARIFPRHAVRSLASACRKLGVEIIEDTSVISVAEGLVETSMGAVSSDRILVTAGYEGWVLSDHFLPAHNVTGVKGQAALLGVSLEGFPQIYADNHYIIPHASGQVAIGSTSEKIWDGDRETDEALDALLKRAEAICPQLSGAPILERWAGIRPKAPKPDPMIGPIPGQSGLWIANGAFKIGFGIAHHVGALVVDTMLGKAVHIPNRFSIDHHFG